MDLTVYNYIYIFLLLHYALLGVSSLHPVVSHSLVILITVAG
jgi:hypothetical protein